MFTNDLELEVSNVVAKLADDTNLFRMVKNKVDFEEQQEDLLSKFGKWGTVQKMKFNVGKCKVMHNGK